MAEQDLKSTSKLPLIRGSTLDIWLGLYINVMDAQTVSPKHPVLRTLVATDAKTAQLKDPLSQPFEVEEYSALTTVALDKLKEVKNNPEVQRLSQQYEDEFQVTKPEIVRVINTRENLLTEYKEIVRDQNLSAKEILEAIKAHKEADKNKVREIVKKEQGFEGKVSTLKEDARSVLGKAKEIYINVFQRIPEQKRVDLPPPEEIQRRPGG